MDGEPQLETWVLEHPELGRIELALGYDQDFAAATEDWPEEPDEEVVRLRVGDSMAARTKAVIHNPPVRAQVTIGGDVHRRFANLHAKKFPIDKHKPGSLTTVTDVITTGEPYLRIQRNPWGEVQAVSLHRRQGTETEVIEFDPPAGSRGEAYQKALEESSVKRTVYPMLAGLGKGGWALFILLFGGFFGRILDWILSFVPDWELPEVTVPSITLPAPKLPNIALPVPTWPEWHLPDLPEAPEWLLVIMEYSKIWVPIVLGIIAGIIALRNHRKSEAAKRDWKERYAGGHDSESR